MPSKTDKIVAALEELLKKRGTQKPTDRLGLERPVLSRDFENKPMAGWEKAAALMGAAVSPASTIASMVLAPPEEETLFDRQIIGPDGKPTILPKTSETVVPRMKKQQRAAMKPNPVISAIQRHFAKGPTEDPANDILHQKINDRNFLVHATRPKDANRIKDIGGVMPSGENLPRQILKDPVVKKAIEDGKFRLEAHSIFSDKPTHIVRDDGRRYRLVKDRELALGRPALTPSSAPGVSLSRQMTVPALNPEKSYRFLLNPAGQKTFSTAEPGFNKPYADKWHTSGGDMHESEQRTFGVPYPVKVGTRATTPSTPKGPTEEMVPEEKTHYYRATMGNENIKKLQERLGVIVRSRRDELWDEYQKLDKLGSDLYDQLSGMKPTDPFYKTTLAAWTDAAKKAKEVGDAYYGVKSKSLMPEIPKSDFDAWEPKPAPISKPAPAPAPKVASTSKTSDFDAWDDWAESKFPGWKKLVTEKKQLSKKYLAQMNDPSTSMSDHIKTAEELTQATDAMTEFMKKMGLK